MSAAPNPTLAVVFTNGAKPNLYPSCKPLPIIGKPPPIIEPSNPYFILFLNDAATLSLPVNPSVASGSNNKDSLPGSDTKRSVAPTIATPSIALAAILLIFFVLAPFILFISPLICPAVLVLRKTFCMIPPGTANCVINPTKSPLHVSGLSGCLFGSAICSSNFVKNSVSKV